VQAYLYIEVLVMAGEMFYRAAGEKVKYFLKASQDM